MNRIRAAYLQLVPDVGPFLVMSAHDDPRGIGITMGVDPGRPSVLHLLGGTPTVVMVLNSVLAGVIWPWSHSRSAEEEASSLPASSDSGSRWPPTWSTGGV